MTSLESKDIFICQYKTCKELYKHPVTLICCGELICEQHLNDLIIHENDTDGRTKIKCCFCEFEYFITKEGLPRNKKIDQLIDLNYSDDFNRAKNSIFAFDCLKSDLDTIKSGEYAANYFNQLRSKVNKRRIEEKNEIDKHCDKFVSEIDEHELECKQKNITLLENALNEDINSYSKAVIELNEELKSYVVDNGLRLKEMNCEIDCLISSLREKINDHKILSMNRMLLEFEGPSKKLNYTDIGSLKIKRLFTSDEKMNTEQRLSISERFDHKFIIEKQLEDNIRKCDEEGHDLEVCRDKDRYCHMTEIEHISKRINQLKTERDILEKILELVKHYR